MKIKTFALSTGLLATTTLPTTMVSCKSEEDKVRKEFETYYKRVYDAATKSPDTELSKEDKNKLKNLWEKYLKNLKGVFERQRDTYNKEKTASIEKAQKTLKDPDSTDEEKEEAKITIEGFKSYANYMKIIVLNQIKKNYEGRPVILLAKTWINNNEIE